MARKESNKEVLAAAAQEAVHAIAGAAELAKATIAQAAMEATKVVNAKNADGTNDHDILIELRTKMVDLADDIKDLKDGTSTQIEKHEAAIVMIKDEISDLPLIRKLNYGAVGFILIAVLSAVVYLVIHK